MVPKHHCGEFGRVLGRSRVSLGAGSPSCLRKDENLCVQEGKAALPLPMSHHSPRDGCPWCPPCPCPPQCLGLWCLCFSWVQEKPVPCPHVQPAIPSRSAWPVAFLIQNASRLIAFDFIFQWYSFNWSEACFPLCRCSTLYLFLLHATASQRRYFCLSFWWVCVCVRGLGRMQ